MVEKRAKGRQFEQAIGMDLQINLPLCALRAQERKQLWVGHGVRTRTERMCSEEGKTQQE